MRFALLLLSLLVTVGCSVKSVRAPEEKIQEVRYRHPGAAAITLVTVLNVGSNNGAHTALIINASERVIFDPAGSFSYVYAPEQNDVLFGANPAIVDSYIDYHTRFNYYTTAQTVDVLAEVAEGLLHRVKENGAVSQALCSQSISALLVATPGFERIQRSYFPDQLAISFATLPNVRTRVFRQPEDIDQTYEFHSWVGQPARFNIE